MHSHKAAPLALWAGRPRRPVEAPAAVALLTLLEGVQVDLDQLRVEDAPAGRVRPGREVDREVHLAGGVRVELHEARVHQARAERVDGRLGACAVWYRVQEGQQG